MSWLRAASLPFGWQPPRPDLRHGYEPHASYSSFVKHWQQAHDIIQRSQAQHMHDDVLGVVNHLEQLSTLLVLEARARELCAGPASCLQHLLDQDMLDKLYEWAQATGKYENAVRLEELKLFGSLVTHYSTQVLAAEQFVRPLLKLLTRFRNELPPPNLEGQLVTVLYQLCVALMQNVQLIDLFYLTTHTQSGAHAEFIIVRLLLSSVHREGATGATARDGLLLCAKMSARAPQLAECMLAGNTCVVLATGLSGLYSHLPRTLGDRVYRLTPDDINHVNKLTLFINSLEFSDAVAQVAHPSIRKQLLDLLHHGFLVPVMGPALLQTRAGLQSGAAEQAAATAYLELCVRCVTAAGLLRPVLAFLLRHRYDGVPLVLALLRRLQGDSQLSLVTLTLVETLVELGCEDVMLELVVRPLLSGGPQGPWGSQGPGVRRRAKEPDAYREAAHALLNLTPSCCARPIDKTSKWVDEMGSTDRRAVDPREDESRRNGLHGDIAMTHLLHGINNNYGNPNESLFGNYHAYLCNARFEIVSRTLLCANWSSRYDTVTIPKKKPEHNNKDRDTHNTQLQPDFSSAIKEPDSLISSTSGYETLKTSETSEKEPSSLTSLHEDETKMAANTESKMAAKEDDQHDSLVSVGESSGYDSFQYKLEEADEDFAEESFKRSIRRTRLRDDGDQPVVRSWRANVDSPCGPLLGCLLQKAAALLESDVAAVCRVTGLLAKLAAFPIPPLMALLLCPGGAPTPHGPSLFQILSRLTREVDEVTRGLDNVSELVDRARLFLVRREMALAAPRGPPPDNECSPGERSPLVEPKRRSLSSSFSSIFSWRQAPASPHTVVQNASASPQRRLEFTQEAYWNQSVTLRSILNAVLLDEWLKELAALCEEQALRLSGCETDGYVRAVGL